MVVFKLNKFKMRFFMENNFVEKAYYGAFEVLYRKVEDVSEESRVKGTICGLGVSILKGVTHIPQKLLSTLEAPIDAIINIVGYIFLNSQYYSLNDAAMSLFVDLPFHAMELIVSPVTTLVKGVVDGVGFIVHPKKYADFRAGSCWEAREPVFLKIFSPFTFVLNCLDGDCV